MWLKRNIEDRSQWIYRIGRKEIAIINWVSWCDIYQVFIKTNNLNEDRKIYEKNLDVAKLKGAIEARELGWNIKGVI
tara:strand:+ start:385 stop:615 length:231 start_codon:yes stop_codon:yes gene_type:complete